MLEPNPNDSSKPIIIRALEGEKNQRTPIWLMRQAGRHLPEYRELRARNGSFLDFCYAPAAATEATLQPVRRYDIDAAIVFSDILVIPDALGQKVSFAEGIGPVLDSITDLISLKKLNTNSQNSRLAPVYEIIARVREKLPKEKALFGFAGAPWTLATYMIQGKGGDRTYAREFAYQNPDFMKNLFELLVEAVTEHLHQQLLAGADVVQIFESWAEDIPSLMFEEWVIGPTRRIVDMLRAKVPDAKIIGFPRGASNRAAQYYAATGINAVGLDIGADIEKVRVEIGDKACLQGNLDPMCLVAGGEALENATKHILKAANRGPHIFNLGHGVVPQTPISNVEKLIAIIRNN